jgi:UDP-N-acetylmuramyl pentapeptide phosphotransferase/UDP-N-acetylglucosamine-1-phosphate transferase
VDAVPLLVSAAIAALIAPGALRAFADAGRVRENFRGRQLPFPAGTVAVCAGILALGVLALAERVLDEQILAAPAGIAEGWTSYAPLDVTAHVDADHPLDWLPLWLGVAFLGLLDDILDLRPRGWRGHLRAVAGGGFSTGAMKAAGTAALAFAVLARGPAPLGEVLLGVLVIALATNLFNLLDLRPGRATKAWVLLAAALLLAEWDSGPLRVVGPLAGALLVLGVHDLRERCMLGDTGANLLGALAGTWLILALGTTGEIAAAAVLLGLTIFGEFRSFTHAIERVPPLRVLDSIGRRTDA